MAEPTVPTPRQAPAKAGQGIAKALKGHPPWLYAVVIAGALAVAYMVRQRQNAAAAAAAEGAQPAVDGYASANYDTTGYPGGTQGASYPGQPAEATGGWGNFPAPTWDELVNLIRGPGVPTGGGAPNNGGVEVHQTPTAELIPVQDAPPVYAPPPPPPPATSQAPPHVASSGPQPISGDGIYYNPDRKLRAVTRKHANGKWYRHYESRLNKGDWGQGGVVGPVWT